MLFSRFKKQDQHSSSVGGIGLGFKDSAGSMRGFVASSSGNLSTSAPAANKGPATDRLSAMKEAFKAQYVNQVRFFRKSSNVAKN